MKVLAICTCGAQYESAHDTWEDWDDFCHNCPEDEFDMSSHDDCDGGITFRLVEERHES